MAKRAPLWTPEAMAKATRGRWLSAPRRGWAPTQISYNLLSPRAPGHVIICMTPVSWARYRPDTSRNLATWAEGGAIGAIIQREQLATVRVLPLPRGFPLLQVKNTRYALSHLGRAARSRFSGLVVALTGTVGKTTTREMIARALTGAGRRPVITTAGNNNNIPGVERTIASTPARARACVCEMGFGQPRDGIAKSSRRLRPQIAMITTVGAAHLDVLTPEEQRGGSPGSPIELVADAKSGIFEGLEPGGVAVLGRDHARYDRVRAAAARRGAKILSYGRDPKADARLLDCALGPAGSRVRCDIAGTPLEFELPIIGLHMAINAVGALTVAHAAGADLKRAAAALEGFVPVGGRAQVVTITAGQGERATLIDDSFNATPASVRSTLELLQLVAEGRRRTLAVLGDIAHLGARSPELHAELAEAIIDAGVDRVLTVGPMMRHLHDALPEALRAPHADALTGLYRQLREELRGDDVVTVKASIPAGLAAVAEALRAGRATLEG